MPALGGASAEPLRFLDFLIHAPSALCSSMAPERFAVHKMIVAARRRTGGDGAAKVSEDRQQAGAVLTTMGVLRREEDLADVWIEAWGRGPSWRDALRTTLRSFDEITFSTIVSLLSRGTTVLGSAPRDYGLIDGA